LIKYFLHFGNYRAGTYDDAGELADRRIIVIRRLWGRQMQLSIRPGDRNDMPDHSSRRR
jgi:hypothetical protein